MPGLREWLNSDIGAPKSSPGSKLEVIEQNDSLYSEWDDGDDEGSKSLDAQYHIGIVRKLTFIIVCIILMFFSAGFIITQQDGYAIEYWDVYRVVWNHIINGTPNPDVDGWKAYFDDHVVCNLRLPRIAIGLVAGFGLAVAGAVMQSTMKNPMADSYTTGVSSGAAFGAALAIVLNVTIIGHDGDLLLLAFLFSLV
ncbi:MAG: iron ABC transporter permease, partial [Candidatus Methanomethylophilus sp.]|nr:iron ABC transporter permease [Methanomethylophilus sp.]